MLQYVSKASAFGTCFGVRDAIEMALSFPYPAKLTILGQLVHNRTILEKLDSKGIKRENSLEASPTTPYVMLTAHGVANTVRERLRGEGYEVLDASCPLVSRVHKQIIAYEAEGLYPIVIGQKKHVEVLGIVGNLKEYTVVTSMDDIKNIPKNKEKYGVVSQTTQQISFVRRLVEDIKEYVDGEVEFTDTVCRPTKQRQEAIRDLVIVADLVIVIGGLNSSNTGKLKKVCDDSGVRAYHIEHPKDIQWEWFEGATHVGITGGTSTPIELIEEMYTQIKERFQCEDGAPRK